MQIQFARNAKYDVLHSEFAACTCSDRQLKITIETNDTI